jgi:hypothetical protein
MAGLVWKHGRTKAEALAAIQGALKEAGYNDSVKWTGYKAEARYGAFASILHADGEVTDDTVVLEKCGGIAGGIVMNHCRELLQRIFPGGS